MLGVNAIQRRVVTHAGEINTGAHDIIETLAGRCLRAGASVIRDRDRRDDDLLRLAGVRVRRVQEGEKARDGADLDAERAGGGVDVMARLLAQNSRTSSGTSGYATLRQ